MAEEFPLADYHVHTERCGHAVGKIDEYVERAKSAGLTEMGFSDHLPLFHTIDASLAMSWDQFPLYLFDVRRLRENQTEIKVKLGIEVDYFPKHAQQIGHLLAQHDFDYVFGSVHFLDGWGIDDRRDIDRYGDYELEDIYKRYFDLLEKAAESQLFDILAHPDLVKKFFQLKPEPVDLYERVIKRLAATGIAIEVSSAGLRKPCQEIYPSRAFLEICKRHDIPITLGSDAHAPDQVGFEFSSVLEEIRAAGYSEIALFKERQMTMVKIV